MAKIKKIQLKTLTRWENEFDVGFKASIFMDNKRIGDVLLEGNEDDIQVHIENEEQRIEFEKRINSYYEEKPASFQTVRDFLQELAELTAIEKMYVKEIEKGKHVLLNFRPVKRLEEPETFKYARNAQYGAIDMEDAQRLVDKYQPVEYDIYQSKQDFII